ncbi:MULTISPECIES: LysR family transcriptional regulator [unclassified Pseudomonas]|uniref:LysR family transcriptional regulator n=1 Tax=unclassified Pseudomonas TaxID=196821 RepID=UPI00096047E7|nr:MULTISPECIES: LysR family transcriptional regulator [unclassified Pseudomonas]OLU13708.1 LysR family transcriptional regulator [Pseudomonas sp. PA1(2017)]OLU27069.1 LysR family transcriptional regulator [Pseudomonas sp. PA27(2017)]
MQLPDLNLLVALDVLLEEGSVVGAARRMHLSPPAMSRTLTRIREAVGDPILVRAGRGLVPTPRALELREQVRDLVEQASGIFRSQEVELTSLDRAFNIRTNDIFMVCYGGRLVELVREQAPNVMLRFVPEIDGDDDAMRAGRIDLAIGASLQLPPEIKHQGLFMSRFVGLARADHPIFDEMINAERFAAFDQISVSRRGLARGPIDKVLEQQGLSRRVVTVSPSFFSAVLALRDSDLILPMPNPVVAVCNQLGLALRSFEIPLPLSPVRVHQSWHPRFDNDSAHRWLRGLIKRCCEENALGV